MTAISMPRDRCMYPNSNRWASARPPEETLLLSPSFYFNFLRLACITGLFFFASVAVVVEGFCHRKESGVPLKKWWISSRSLQQLMKLQPRLCRTTFFFLFTGVRRRNTQKRNNGDTFFFFVGVFFFCFVIVSQWYCRRHAHQLLVILMNIQQTFSNTKQTLIFFFFLAGAFTYVNLFIVMGWRLWIKKDLSCFLLLLLLLLFIFPRIRCWGNFLVRKRIWIILSCSFFF